MNLMEVFVNLVRSFLYDENYVFTEWQLQLLDLVGWFLGLLAIFWLIKFIWKLLTFWK